MAHFFHFTSLHFTFFTINFGESYSRTSRSDDQGIRRSAAKIERGSYPPDWCPPASLSSIKRGLGTERARLGTLEPLPQNVQD